MNEKEDEVNEKQKENGIEKKENKLSFYFFKEKCRQHRIYIEFLRENLLK